MSNPTNDPSYEPISESTKQMDLDAEVPNNLSSKKTQVAYSEPKQDADLPSIITDWTYTQTCGLCHNKKSEPELLVEQPIAATDSSQNTLLVALDPSASSILPVALDPSANPILSATLDSCSARLSNFSAGLSLHSQSTTNLSAALDLHSASCFNSNKMCTAFQLVVNEHKGLFNDKTAPTFRLIVRFNQQYKSKMQQDLVNISLSKTISIAKLGTSSITSQMMAYLNFNQVSNNNDLSFFNNGCLCRLIVNSIS
jgi:hypothetical protein